MQPVPQTEPKRKNPVQPNKNHDLYPLKKKKRAGE